VIDELDFDMDKPLEIVLAGSLFVKGESPDAIEKLKEDVRQKHPERDAVFSILTHPPVAGAVLWALEPFPVDHAFSRVTSQL
jgi:hypothetical protein